MSRIQRSAVAVPTSLPAPQGGDSICRKLAGAQARGPSMGAQGAGMARRVDRSPRTRERLHRLRLELARIDPLPGTVEEARQEIVMALARAHLAVWTVPGLADPAVLTCRGGSVRIRLISHEIVINPSGAFRILDKLAPSQPWFELAGRGGRVFRMPADEDTAAG